MNGSYPAVAPRRRGNDADHLDMVRRRLAGDITILEKPYAAEVLERVSRQTDRTSPMVIMNERQKLGSE